jgi:hypothetical protein
MVTKGSCLRLLGNVPDTDAEIVRGRGQDVLSGGVKVNQMQLLVVTCKKKLSRKPHVTQHWRGE